MTMSSVDVSVIADKIVEEDETFNVMLSIPSSVSKEITADTENKVVVTISDSTGKYITRQMLTASRGEPDRN